MHLLVTKNAHVPVTQKPQQNEVCGPCGASSLSSVGKVGTWLITNSFPNAVIFFPLLLFYTFVLTEKGTFYKVFLCIISQGKAHLFNKLYQIHCSVVLTTRAKMNSWHLHEIKIKVFRTL